MVVKTNGNEDGVNRLWWHRVQVAMHFCHSNCTNFIVTHGREGEFEHEPPRERDLTHYSNPDSEAEMACVRRLPRGSVFHLWVAVEINV